MENRYEPEREKQRDVREYEEGKKEHDVFSEPYSDEYEWWNYGTSFEQ